MKQKDNTETKAVAGIGFFIVAIFLWRWYSHVWLPHTLGWLVCILIAAIQAIAVHWGGNLIRMTFVCILIASLLAQILSWGGAIQLPILH